MEKSTNQDTRESGFWQGLKLAWEMGYTIALPLVFLALLGRFLDKKFATSPWLLLTGILISIIISTLSIYFKTIKIIADIDQKSKKQQTKKEN